MMVDNATQISTLAEGWNFEAEDVATALEMAEALGMPLPDFVGIVDEIVAGVAAAGGAVDDRFSASYVMYCYARAASGLPLN